MYDDDDVRSIFVNTLLRTVLPIVKEKIAQDNYFFLIVRKQKRDAKTKQYVASVFVQGRTTVMRKTPFNDNCNNVFVVQSLLGFCWFGEVLQFYAKILIL